MLKKYDETDIKGGAKKGFFGLINAVKKLIDSDSDEKHKITCEIPQDEYIDYVEQHEEETK